MLYNSKLICYLFLGFLYTFCYSNFTCALAWSLDIIKPSKLFENIKLWVADIIHI